MRFSVHAIAAATVFSIATATLASTPDKWPQVDAASQAACLKASGLDGAKSGPPIRFSDKLLIDARVVEGTWPQPHTKGITARILCLYNRKTKRIEVQELSQPVAKETSVKDIWWRVESIGGRDVVEGSEVTMILSNDSKIGGKSGCNGYSARYQITDDIIQVFPPMISTRMACAPGIMSQEQNYQNLLAESKSFTLNADGQLVVASSTGTTTTFVRK